MEVWRSNCYCDKVTCVPTGIFLQYHISMFLSWSLLKLVNKDFCGIFFYFMYNKNSHESFGYWPIIGDQIFVLAKRFANSVKTREYLWILCQDQGSILNMNKWNEKLIQIFVIFHYRVSSYNSRYKYCMHLLSFRHRGIRSKIYLTISSYICTHPCACESFILAVYLPNFGRFKVWISWKTSNGSHFLYRRADKSSKLISINAMCIN